jgi:hypothetical protein
VKRKTFYGISLSLPYIALLFGGALTLVAYARGLDPAAAFSPGNIFLGMVFFFTISGIAWGPFYTWLVIVILFWGRGKKADEVRRMYLLSPVLLGCSMGIPALLVDIPASAVILAWSFLHIVNLDFVATALFEDYPQEGLFGIPMLWVFMAAICLVVGYVFVGVVLLIEKGMKRRNLFKEDENITGVLPPPQ